MLVFAVDFVDDAGAYFDCQSFAATENIYTECKMYLMKISFGGEFIDSFFFFYQISFSPVVGTVDSIEFVADFAAVENEMVNIIIMIVKITCNQIIIYLLLL